MSIRNLLETAKTNFSAHQRQLEIADLDLTPEEYMLVREAHDPFGIELMSAILERVNDVGWVIDSNTHRYVKPSTFSVGSRSQYAIAITSNTRRFIVKVFRDYPELTEIDLISCRHISDALHFVDIQIENVEEMRRQKREQAVREAQEAVHRAKEAEHNLAVKLIQEIGEQVHAISNVKIACFVEGERQIGIVEKFLNSHCEDLPQGEIEIDGVLGWNGALEYAVVDDVPCRNIYDGDGNLRVVVGYAHIRKCACLVNLGDPQVIQFELSEDQRHIRFVSGGTMTDEFTSLLKALGFCCSRSEHYEKAFVVSENRSVELEKVRQALELHLQSIQTPFPSISVFGKSQIGLPDAEVISGARDTVDYLAENTKLLIWNSHR